MRRQLSKSYSHDTSDGAGTIKKIKNARKYAKDKLWTLSLTHSDNRQATRRRKQTIVNSWNSLPDYIVDVDSVHTFKSRLDKFWPYQPIMYDWKADLTAAK